jgi:hypothetical protein
MGKPYAPFDVAGAGDGLTVGLVRHSQRKRGAPDRPDLRGTAPVLDPTLGGASREGGPYPPRAHPQIAELTAHVNELSQAERAEIVRIGF